MVNYYLDTETYKYNEKKREWNPSKNTKDFVLGCVIKEGKKRPYFFYKAEEMFQFLLEEIRRNVKNGHNSFFYSHYHDYDCYAYAVNHLKDFDHIDIKRTGSFLAFMGDLKKEKKKKEEKRQPKGYLLDTNSFYSGSLKTIGEMLGLSKLEMPKSVKRIDDLKAYCYRDVQIVQKFMKSIKEVLKRELNWNVKVLKTAPMLGIGYFRHFCDKNYVCTNCKVLDKNDLIEKEYKIKGESVKGMICKKCGNKVYRMSSYLFKQGKLHPCRNFKLIKTAYRGARTTLFQEKREKVKGITCLDYQSLYPFVMAKRIKFPDLTTEYRVNFPEENYPFKPWVFDNFYIKNREELLNQIGIMTAEVKLPKKDLKYLPLRHKTKGGLWYKENQRAISTWTIFEMKRFVEEGGEIVKIYNIVLWKELFFNPFEKMMENLYEIKKNSNGVKKAVVKLLANSSYGKFGEMRKDIHREICHRKDAWKLEGNGYKIVNDFGEEYLLEKNLGEKPTSHTNPIISALITAYARDELYRGLKKVPFKDLYYCDTDSIMFKGNHLNKFKISEEMGDLKIEFKDVIGIFVKKKIYQLESKEGEILKSTGKIDLDEEIISGEKSYYKEKMIRFKSGLRDNNFEKVGTFENVEKRIRDEPKLDWAEISLDLPDEEIASLIGALPTR
jgi:hypothetical protein